MFLMLRVRVVFEKKLRGHPELNRGPIDLQSIALPLSYTPLHANVMQDMRPTTVDVKLVSYTSS